jgi:hypothetical protein
MTATDLAPSRSLVRVAVFDPVDEDSPQWSVWVWLDPDTGLMADAPVCYALREFRARNGRRYHVSNGNLRRYLAWSAPATYTIRRLITDSDIDAALRASEQRLAENLAARAAR